VEARAANVVPFATYGLVVVIAIVFALERAFDATDSLPSLVRMGALVSSRVLGPPYEWWRLGASMFLHGGAYHVALNGYVLFILGRSMERILGASRFLILFFVSGLAGGLASAAWMRPEPSVGASGCLWGILAAQAVLAFRPNGIVPTDTFAISKRTAVTNLALNVVVSFLPHVDWAAHLGGGLAGGALMLSGVLVRRSAWIPGFAIALSGVMLACVPIAIRAGRPDDLSKPPTLARRSFPIGARARVTAEMPDGLSVATDPSGAVFGDILADAALIEIRIFRQDPPVDPEHEAEWRDGMLETLRTTPPSGYAVVDPPDPRTISGHLVVVGHFAAETLELERSFLLLGAKVMARVDVLVWKKYALAYAGFGERVIDSLRVEMVD
jgi:membrane associated rhomboid family serine protease